MAESSESGFTWKEWRGTVPGTIAELGAGEFEGEIDGKFWMYPLHGPCFLESTLVHVVLIFVDGTIVAPLLVLGYHAGHLLAYCLSQSLVFVV